MASSLIDIDEILECPICLATPTSTPIYQCVENGHIICNTCVTSQGKKCPVCRSVTGFSRCLTAEKLWREFQKNQTGRVSGSSRRTASPCIFNVYGCVFVCSDSSVLSQHQRECIYRRVHCPDVTCHYVGAANQILARHCANDHTAFKTSKFSDAMIFRLCVKEDHWKTVTTYKPVKFEAYGHVFFREVRRDELRKSWFFWIYFDGTPLLAQNLIAKIRLLTPDGKETITSHKDNVVPLDDGLPEVLDKFSGLVVSDDFMKRKIVRNEEFFMSITVRQQKKLKR